MANGKGIEIRIAATGAPQAAAEIAKVEAAVEATAAAAEDLGKSRGNTGFGGMLDGVPERAEEAAEAIEKVADAAVPMSEHLGEAAEEMESLGEAADDAGPKLDKLINIQKAQVAAEIGKALGQVGDIVRQTSGKFAAADPEFSQTLENVADGLDTASAAAMGAAMGFSVGGQFGAAVGGLVGGGIVLLRQELDDVTDAMVRASESAAMAAEMEQKHARMLELGADAYNFAAEASDRLAESTAKTTEAVREQVGELERQNRILNAEDKAEGAKRDREDAAAIRGGAAPEDVAAKRAQDDAEKEIARINREEQIKKEAVPVLQQNARDTAIDRDALKSLGTATPEEIEAAEKTAADAKKKFDDAAAAAAEAATIARSQRQEVRDRTGGKVDDLGARKEDRLGREQAQAEADAKRKADAEARAAERAERDALGGQLEGAEGRLNDTARSRGLNIAARGGEQGNKALQDIGKQLADGTDSKELDKIAAQVVAAQARLGAGNVAALMQVLEGLQKQAVEIENIKGQIRNGRNGR